MKSRTTQTEQSDKHASDAREFPPGSHAVSAPSLTSRSLAAFWRDRNAEPGKYQRPLTGRERGQLGHLQKYLGTETCRVISYALNNWDRFGSRASAAAGLGSWPPSPHIGFLLKHHEVAVNLMQSIAPAVHPVEVGRRVERPVIVRETPYKMTDEEFCEMMAELETLCSRQA